MGIVGKAQTGRHTLLELSKGNCVILRGQTAKLFAEIPGSSDKCLTGNGEKLTQALQLAATGSAWLVFIFPLFRRGEGYLTGPVTPVLNGRLSFSVNLRHQTRVPYI